MEIDKDKLLDSKGRYYTQSLFLEFRYGKEAVYTLKERDFVYKGKTYPSIKRLYLEMEDPTEYMFATTYFSTWEQWKRICANQWFSSYINNWREELELQLRCKGIQAALKVATGEKGFQAAKWLADRGWDARKAGRPSKEEVDREKAFIARVETEYAEDFKRLLQ